MSGPFLGQRIEVRQSQSLVMTPQLRQAIKLLQFSNMEVSAFVEEELEKNPLLERDERPEIPDAERTLPEVVTAPRDAAEGVRAESLPDFAVEARLGAAAPTVMEPPADRPLEEALADHERRLITAALERHRTVGRAADALGISRHALRYRMQRLGFQPEMPEEEPASAAGSAAQRGTN